MGCLLRGEPPCPTLFLSTCLSSVVSFPFFLLPCIDVSGVRENITNFATALENIDTRIEQIASYLKQLTSYLPTALTIESEPMTLLLKRHVGKETDTHTHAQTDRHTHTDTQTHTDTHTCTHAHTDARTQTDTHAQSRTQAQARKSMLTSTASASSSDRPQAESEH